MVNKFEILHKCTSSLYEMEKQLMETVEIQIDDRSVNRFPKATEVLRMIHPVLRAQVATMENLSVQSGAGPIWKEAMTTVTSVLSGIYSKVKSGKVSCMLKEVYGALNMLSINYTTLHAAALALKDNDVADRALTHLKAITPLIVDLSEVIPRVMLDELVDDHLDVNSKIADEAVRNTHEAWHVHQSEFTTH